MTKSVAVYVKGHWEGFKEISMEVDRETVEKFDDGSGGFYAVCVYEDGEPTYMFMKKRLWENWDEVRELMRDKSLSDEEKAERMRDLT